MAKINCVVIKTFHYIIRGIIPGVLILFIHFSLISLFKNDAYLTTKYYQNGLFSFFRQGFDNTLAYADFPWIYLILPLVLLFMIWDLLSRKGDKKWLKRFSFLFNYSSLFFFLFYVFWGYNYYAVQLDSRMGFDSHKIELGEDYITDKLNSLLPQLNPQRASIEDSRLLSIDSKIIENEIRPHLKKFLSDYGYETSSDSRVKSLFPGALMRLRTSGIYIPYVFEGHFDSSIYPSQWPFTIAHEMAHAYGVTDEKECNFIAFIVCMKSKNPVVNYSAMIAYWRYLALALLKTNREKYLELRSKLSSSVQTDLDKINESIQKYPEWFPKSRDKIYDQYLKSHGIAEGIISYDKMLEMIELWNLSKQLNY